MKKNKMLRIASAMLVLALITTCVISGTFAKYVTVDTKTDAAHVAKWGVEIASSGDSAFLTSYTGTNGEVIKSEGSEPVVAPGAKNTTGNKITIKGKPEVKFSVAFSMEATNDVFLPAGEYADPTTSSSGATFSVADSGYYPIVYTLTGKIGGNEITEVSGNLNTIKAKVNTLTATYDPNSTVIADDYLTLTWKWLFDDGKNKEDTVLGNVAAGTTTVEGAVTRIGYTITMTATQLD